MSNNDMFDLIAEEAPAPSGDLHRQILAAGHRARRRRRAGVAFGVVCVVAAVAAPVIVWNAHNTGQEVIVAENPAPSTQPSPDAAKVGPAKPGSAEAYDAVIRSMAAELTLATGADSTADRSLRGEVGRWYILDHTCGNVVEQDRPCNPQPLSPHLRNALAAALQPIAPVEFVPTRDDAYPPGNGTLQPVKNNGILIQLGPINQAGKDLAEVPIAGYQGAGNARGQTYRVQFRNGHWTTTGIADGTMWIA